MTDPMGLRERKKVRLRETIAATAIRMFLESGFDGVSITDIARAAEVSRRTLFSYFPTKEDLVLQRFADHEDEAARTVRGRRPDQPPLDALRAALLEALRQRDPATGLNDDPEIIAFLRLVTDTESLAARLMRYTARGVDLLSDALCESGFEPLTARLVAAQVIAVQHELTFTNHAYLAEGQSAADRYPAAVRATEHAFDLLRDGLNSASPDRNHRPGKDIRRM
ncbi:TetR/AcrR family transcriptional regulator [Nocardia sp. BMG111209]|uniref:TetR/AcrR family transcriptional regulator n=1 Tax=Nocardia sp. BMG111209 TaxID=1160137 RepID=UPI0003683BDE|nr:TetR/AcrR family transcriptional regulator [Nocardia sp. BMG111209]